MYTSSLRDVSICNTEKLSYNADYRQALIFVIYGSRFRCWWLLRAVVIWLAAAVESTVFWVTLVYQGVVLMSLSNYRMYTEPCINPILIIFI